MAILTDELPAPDDTAPSRRRRIFTRRPKAAEEGEPSLIAPAEQVVGATLVQRVHLALFYLAIWLSLPIAVGLVLVLTRPVPDRGPAPEISAAQLLETTAGAQQAEEHAERVVQSWLTATRDQPGDVAALISDVQPSMLPETAAAVTHLAAAGATPAQDIDGVWSVIVGADVTDPGQPTTRRYYQLVIELTDDQVRALTTPTPIAPLTPGGTLELAYPYRLTTGTDLADTVAAFLAAHAAASGDLARYLSPQATITAITPAPYTSITVQQLAADVDLDTATTPPTGQEVRVLAGATATRTDGQRQPVTYALTLRARDGRWEVAQIDPLPALRPPSPQTRTTS